MSIPSSDALQEPVEALQFLRALWELNHALISASRSMKKHLGVTGPERLFIRLVGSKPGIAPAEIAEIMHVHRSTVTPLIKRLERRRLIARAGNPVDGRSFHLFLTPTGRRIDTTRDRTIEAIVGEAVAESSRREVETTAAMLTRVARRLSGDVKSRARPATPARRARAGAGPRRA
jgi:MarR family transcriptional regulator, organic hydroperoxide resistance regulator